MSQPVGIDPAAERPDVAFRVHVPDEWLTLDLDPATSDRWVEGVLDDRIAEHPEAAPHRGHLRRILQGLVADQRRAGVFLAAVLAAPGGRPGELIGATLTLSWVQLASQPDDLGWIARYLADEDLADGEREDARQVDLMELPAGPPRAVRVRTSFLAPVPESSRKQRVASTQFTAPVPDSGWLAVITASTPNLDLAELADRLAEDVTQSLTFLDDAAAEAAAGPRGRIGRR